MRDLVSNQIASTKWDLDADQCVSILKLILTDNFISFMLIEDHIVFVCYILKPDGNMAIYLNEPQLKKGTLLVENVL